jgi:hypothetical protein
MTLALAPGLVDKNCAGSPAALLRHLACREREDRGRNSCRAEATEGAERAREKQYVAAILSYYK